MRARRKKMRLLIDGRHTVITTWFRGWSGLNNGALLRAAEVEGFDLLITADQDLSYQQNLAGRSMALLVLNTNNWRLVKAQMAEISAAIDDATPGSFVFVDIGHARGECFCRL